MYDFKILHNITKINALTIYALATRCDSVSNKKYDTLRKVNL